MSNVNALNTFLRGVDSADTLIKEYYRRCPDSMSLRTPPIKNDRDQLDSCATAANFAINFLSGTSALASSLALASATDRKALNEGTAGGLLEQLKGSGGLRIGYLVSEEREDHECVFAGSGDQWAFYQANINGGTDQRYTLAPKLNRLQRNWNIFDMNDRQFAEFFVGLTNSGYSGKLFRMPLTRWTVVAATPTGQLLLK